MARKTIKRKSSASGRSRFQPHQLWLAGLGAVSLGRKQVVNAYAGGFEDVLDLAVRAQYAAQDATRSLNGKVVALRKQARAKAAPVQKQMIALAKQAQSKVLDGLAPALAKLGVKPAARKHSAPRKKTAPRKHAAARKRKAA